MQIMGARDLFAKVVALFVTLQQVSGKKNENLD